MVEAVIVTKRWSVEGMRAVGIVAVAIATEVVVEKLVIVFELAPQLKSPPVQLRKLLPVQAVKCPP